MSGGAADDLPGHQRHPPPRHPTIGAGNVLTVHLNNGGKLSIEAGTGFVAFTDQSQVFVFAVVIIEGYFKYYS